MELSRESWRSPVLAMIRGTVAQGAKSAVHHTEIGRKFLDKYRRDIPPPPQLVDVVNAMYKLAPEDDELFTMVEVLGNSRYFFVTFSSNRDDINVISCFARNFRNRHPIVERFGQESTNTGNWAKIRYLLAYSDYTPCFFLFALPRRTALAKNPDPGPKHAQKTHPTVPQQVGERILDIVDDFNALNLVGIVRVYNKIQVSQFGVKLAS